MKSKISIALSIFIFTFVIACLIFILALPQIVKNQIQGEVQNFFKMDEKPDVELDFSLSSLLQGKVNELIVETGPVEYEKIPFTKSRFIISSPQIDLGEYIYSGNIKLIDFERASLEIWMNEENINDYLHNENHFLNWKIRILKDEARMVYSILMVDIAFKGEITIAGDNELQFQSKEIILGNEMSNKGLELSIDEGLFFQLKISRLPLKMNIKDVKIRNKLIKITAVTP